MQWVIYLVFNILLLRSSFRIYFHLEGKGSHKVQSVFKLHYLHVHRPFLLFVMLPAGVKDPVSNIHHDSAHKRLFSELSCTVQIQRLLPFSEPKLSHNKESTAFFHQALPKSLHLALKMIIWQKIA